MSALSFLVLPDAIHVISDTACYRKDGTLGAFRSKVAIPEHYPAAITITGNSVAGEFFVPQMIEAADSFDELVEVAAPAFENLCAEWMPQSELALYIGGFSESRSAFEGYYSRSASFAALDGGDDAATIRPDAFNLERVGEGLYCQPGASAQDAWGPGTSVRQIVDVELFARGLLALQRQKKWGRELGHTEDHHLVGGAGELTTITRDGVTKRTICQWPDVLEAQIAPEPIDRQRWYAEFGPAVRLESKPSNNVVPFTGMNRHERRALAKRRAQMQ